MGKIYISTTNDPAYNLAFEEYLIEKKQACLYLWQNENTIVIGRNQNPYKECNIEKIEEDSIRLIRRRSGGGAVFHDLGNLNFTLISDLSRNNLEENFKLVEDALALEGIQASFNGRNDIHVGDKKISGNAFYEDGDIFCHHGTLLVDVNMDKLSKYLTASKLKLRSKGIDSVKSRVINLRDIKEDIDMASIKKSFIRAYGSREEVVYIGQEDLEKNPYIREKVERYRSWDWVYGQAPRSNVYYEEKFSWGIVDLELFVESGLIKEAEVYTDSIINDDFKLLAKNLKNKKFMALSLREAVEESIKNPEIKADLISLLEKL